jgi:hypothetical protein
MSRILNGDAMINSARRRTMTPEDTSTFTDADILDILDEEMNAQVLDKLKVLHGDNLTVVVDIPRNDEGSYDIPYRAVGNTLRDLSMVQGDVLYELSQISIGELPDHTYSSDSNAYMDMFYMENSQIKLVGPSRSYTSIRMRFMLRPNVLTKQEEAGTISDIVTDDIAGTTTLVLSSVGRNFVSGVEYDIIGAKSPNKIKAFDKLPTSVSIGSSGSIVFNTADLSNELRDIKKGDYVSLAGETPVPNIPTEMHPLLAQAAAVQLLESMTDTEALTNAQKRMEKMTASIQTLVDNRVDLAPKKIKPRHSALTSAIGTRRKNRGRY